MYYKAGERARNNTKPQTKYARPQRYCKMRAFVVERIRRHLAYAVDTDKSRILNDTQFTARSRQHTNSTVPLINKVVQREKESESAHTQHRSAQFTTTRYNQRAVGEQASRVTTQQMYRSFTTVQSA